jgi:hypothetical protein
MVNLLKKVKDMEPYTIIIDGQEISYPAAAEEFLTVLIV